MATQNFSINRPPATRALAALLQPVDDRRFDLVPDDALGIPPSTPGAPVRTAFARHPAIEHDHQAEGRFARGRGRVGQLDCGGHFAQVLDVVVNETVAGRAASDGCHLCRSFIGTGFGGGVDQPGL